MKNQEQFEKEAEKMIDEYINEPRSASREAFYAEKEPKRAKKDGGTAMKARQRLGCTFLEMKRIVFNKHKPTCPLAHCQLPNFLAYLQSPNLPPVSRSDFFASQSKVYSLKPEWLAG